MREFIAELSNRYNVKRKDLLEKDIIIQKILLDLSKNDLFSKNFVFKGGTCLIKCYLGYYRFSEDIDFTWRDQSIFKHKSQKEIRRIISELKDKIGEILVVIAKNRDLDFKMEKDNKDFMEFGGGNKFVTFKIWYDSEILNERSFIKIQTNFVEHLVFDVSKKDVNCILNKTESEEIKLLYGQDYKEYIKNISLYTYDVKEILCEKVRAILTRRGIKARDFIDVFLIINRYSISVEDFKDQIVDKIKYMFTLYEKYRSNFEEKKKLIHNSDFFKWGYEKELLLMEIDENEFSIFIKDFLKILQDVSNSI
jgi:predicted nucleotidyltransferase component of viral defense system